MPGRQFFGRTALTLGLLGLLTGASFADVAHFANGKVLRGKLFRITGELIDFQPNGHGALNRVDRLHLTNRRDVVETRDGKKYFGEIIYVDKFKIEMDTPSGRVKINHLLVQNVVLGSPLQQPMNDFMESTGQQTAKHSLSSYQPGDLSMPGGNVPQPRVNPDDEDTDAIPDRAP